MFLTNRGTSEYYFPYTQIRAVAHIIILEWLEYWHFNPKNTIETPIFYLLQDGYIYIYENSMDK